MWGRCRKHLTQNYQAADYDIARAERGIIYIDEMIRLLVSLRTLPLHVMCLVKAYNEHCLKS